MEILLKYFSNKKIIVTLLMESNTAFVIPFVFVTKGYEMVTFNIIINNNNNNNVTYLMD